MNAIVIRTYDGEEVDRFDVTGKSEQYIERVERGLAINFDFESYTFGLEEDE